MGGKWIHRLESMNGASKMGVCSNCGPVRICRKDGRWKCKVARDGQRGAPGRRAHGLTPMEARALREGRTCEICGTIENTVVDHDHSTGAIRGILCRNHNAGIGFLEDSPTLLARAISYLQK